MKKSLLLVISIFISITLSAQYTTPYYLNFETSTFPPNGCSVYPAGSAAWTYDSTVSAFGLGHGCIRFDNFNTVSGDYDFRLPVLNFSALQVPYIKFDYAYAFNPNSVNLDALSISWSTGTSNWQVLQFYPGNTLNTGTPTTSFYVPSPADWRTIAFPLQYVLHQPQVKLAIQNNCHNSNAIYVDNIKVFDSATVDVSEIEWQNQLMVFPNPVYNQLTIENNSVFSKSTTFTLYNLIGKVMMTKVLHNKYNIVDLSEFEDSVYMYRLISENGAVKSGKIIKN